MDFDLSMDIGGKEGHLRCGNLGMLGNDFGSGIGQGLNGGNLGKGGSLCDIGLGRGGDLKLVDGGVSSFGGDVEAGGNDGGSTVTGDVFGGFGGVNTEMLGGAGDNDGGPNVSAGDGNVGTDAVGVEVKFGGKGGNLGRGNGGTFLELYLYMIDEHERACIYARSRMIHDVERHILQNLHEKKLFPYPKLYPKGGITVLALNGPAAMFVLKGVPLMLVLKGGTAMFEKNPVFLVSKGRFPLLLGRVAKRENLFPRREHNDADFSTTKSTEFTRLLEKARPTLGEGYH
uniref:Uncharacterized protein n=1 Tax=Salix viminalis TaxID=40686 RepID=A0A6N2MET9_SALVM